MTILAIAS